MGRKKSGYRAPEGLIKIPRSKNWYIKRTVCGKSIFRSTRTSDLMIAEEIYHIVLSDVLKSFKEYSSNKILGKSVPLSQIIERYLKEISPNKAKGGKNDINSSKAILNFFGNSKIDGISKQDIYKFLDFRKSSPSHKTGKLLSGSTINREKSFLSDVFKKAIRWGLVNDNPVMGIEGFTEDKRQRYITSLELKQILSNMKRDHAEMFLTVYYTAQRNGRIYAMQWRQVDLEQRTISFENTIKNKRVPNVLWINDSLYSILLLRQANRRTLTPYIFYKLSLKPYNDYDARRIWKRAANKAGVQDTRPYDLRHKAITDMKKAGFNDSFVGKVVGHSDPRTTKRYTHFSIDETKAPLETLII